VAPAFLFATGFSIVLQSQTQWDHWLHFRLPFWKQMRRLGFILLVAYYSHLQGFKLSRYLMNRNDADMWAKTFQGDILQCVVASLLVVHAVIFLLRKRWLLPWGTSILAGVVALATPWIWSMDFRGKLPLSLALLLNPHKISLFPIFPWICFVLAGSCACHFFLKRVETHREQSFAKAALLLGALMIIAGLLLRGIPFTLPGYASFYTTSPLYLLIRIGCILLICSLLYVLEKNVGWVPKTIQMAGQESLLVYGVHLWVIFSFLRGKLMAGILGLQAGYMRCFLMSLLIALAMLALAGLWHSLKKNYPGATKFGQALTVLVMIAVFALN
jgi:fucose 4-O-acetylase-like acetyltransferase